eukprot:scaffold44215_cov69-Phaeocystis_antarctica.AAC.6
MPVSSAHTTVEVCSILYKPSPQPQPLPSQSPQPLASVTVMLYHLRAARRAETTATAAPTRVTAPLTPSVGCLRQAEDASGGDDGGISKSVPTLRMT